MPEPNSKEPLNEREIIGEVLDTIDNGDHESALLVLKRFRNRNLSPLVYARLLVMLDGILADKLNDLSELLAPRDPETGGSQLEPDAAP